MVLVTVAEVAAERTKAENASPNPTNNIRVLTNDFDGGFCVAAYNESNVLLLLPTR